MKSRRNWTKLIAIGLYVFPGSLFVLALANYVIFSILESGQPSGTANIGLAFLYMAAMINVPTLIAWLFVGISHVMDSN